MKSIEEDLWNILLTLSD